MLIGRAYAHRVDHNGARIITYIFFMTYTYILSHNRNTTLTLVNFMRDQFRAATIYYI